jgi:hypothetical protein
LLNAALLNESDPGMFRRELYYKMDVDGVSFSGGCLPWEGYLRGDVALASFTSTPKRVFFTSIDRTLRSDQWRLRELSCTDPAAVLAIMQEGLDYKNSATTSVTCIDDESGISKVWKFASCGGDADSGSRAMCVGCADPCTAACDSDNMYLAPCTACLPNANTDELIRVLSVDYEQNGVAPGVDSMTVSVTPSTAEVVLALDQEEGYVHCSALPHGTELTSTTTLTATGAPYASFSDSAASVRISGLYASTAYDVFCSTVHAHGNAEMTLVQAVATKESITTACCKTITVSLETLSVLDSGALGTVTVLTNAAPSAGDLTIDVSAGYRSNTSDFSEVGLASRAPFFPRSTTIRQYARPAPVSVAVDGSATNAGLYRVVATLGGAAAAEYQVEYPQGRWLVAVAAGGTMPVPVLLGGSFAPNGAQVNLRFDSSTNRGGENGVFLCTALLMFADATDSGPMCRWSADSTVVSFEATTIVANSTVTLRGGKVKAMCPVGYAANTCSGWSAAAAQTVCIGTHADSVPPVVSVSAPRVVGSCQPFIMDVLSSEGSGGRPWHNATVKVTSTVSAAHTSTIQAYVDAHFSPDAALPIPHATLVGAFANVSVLLETTLCNFLHKCSSQKHSVIGLADAVPTVKILGKAARSVAPGAALSLRTRVDASVCVGDDPHPSDTFQYFWVVYEDGLANTDLVSVSKDPSKFVLPAYSLSRGRNYRVVVTVLNAYSKGAASTAVAVVTAPGDIVVSIDGSPTVQAIAESTSTTLDASASFDSDFPGVVGAASGLTFTWSCVQLSPTLELNCAQGAALVITSPSSTSRTYTADAGAGGGLFRVTLEVSDGVGRQESTEVDLTVVSSNYPRVALQQDSSSSATGSRKVNADVKLVLRSTLTTTQTDSIATWSWDETVNSGTLASVASSALVRSQAAIGSFPFYLTVPAGKLAPGTRYTFTVACGRSGGRVTTMNMDVETNSAPAPGSFALAPATGTEMSTLFSLRAAQWVDEDLPVEYEFSVADTSGTGRAMMLQARSEEPQMQSMLPTNALANTITTTCILLVFDSYSASASATATAEVAASSLSSSTAISLLTSRTSTALSVDDARQSVAVFGPRLNARECSKLKSSACADMHREECSSVPHTCGACLGGYYGQEGHANSDCAGSSSLAEFTAAIAASTQKCSKSSQCAWGFRCGSNKCRPVAKSCPNNCSKKGSCSYVNSFSLDRVETCHFLQDDCLAMCSCKSGYSGPSCSRSAESQANKDTLRRALQSTLDGLIAGEDVTVEAIAGWTAGLSVLTESVADLDDDAVESAIGTVGEILSKGASVGAPLEMLTPLLTTIDGILGKTGVSPSSVSQAPSDTGEIIDINVRRQRQRRWLQDDSTVDDAVYKLMETFVDTGLAAFTPGQAATIFAGAHWGIRLESFMVTQLSSLTIALTAPASATAVAAGAQQTTLELQSVAGSVAGYKTFGVFQLSRTALGSAAVALFKSASLYREPIYLSNPIVLFVGEDTALGGVRVVHRAAEKLFLGDRNVRPAYLEEFVDMCFDEDASQGEPISAYTHLCVASQSTINIACDGQWGKKTLHCPQTYLAPVCYVGTAWPSSADGVTLSPAAVSETAVTCDYALSLSASSVVEGGSGAYKFIPLAGYVHDASQTTTFLQGMWDAGKETDSSADRLLI